MGRLNRVLKNKGIKPQARLIIRVVFDQICSSLFMIIGMWVLLIVIADILINFHPQFIFYKHGFQSIIDMSRILASFAIVALGLTSWLANDVKIRRLEEKIEPTKD